MWTWHLKTMYMFSIVMCLLESALLGASVWLAMKDDYRSSLSNRLYSKGYKRMETKLKRKTNMSVKEKKAVFIVHNQNAA